MFLRQAAGIPVTMVRQYRPRAAVERRALRRLDAMLTYSRDRVPWYRADGRYRRGPLRALADLAELPILRKATLREQPPEAFLAEGVDPLRCVPFRTSGSTGRRVTGWHDEASHDYHMAACFRRFAATGRYLPTYRLSHVRPYAEAPRGFERFKLFRRDTILAELTDAEIAERALANRPHVLAGGPVHLRRMLRALSPAALARLRRTLRLLLPDSELITPGLRAVLCDGFGVPLFDEYSAFEVLNIYYECARGGRHIAEDRVHVEIVDDDGHPLPAGREGHVIVTGFLERAMPLIRYAVGDLGVREPDPCSCGRSFATMRLTKGRADDVLMLSGGRRMYADALWSFAAEFPGLAECFAEQDAGGLVRINVVPADPGADPAGLFDRVRGELFRLAGGPFEVEVVAADRVPITIGGKGRLIASAAPGGRYEDHIE